DEITRYFRVCLQIGWLEEAAATLPRLPQPTARARLDLAAAYAGHGEANRAAALLEPLGQEPCAPDDWLDGAITWYHCRQLERAVRWARRGVAAAPQNLAGHAVLARCLLAAGQPDAALQALVPHPVRGSPPPHSL